MTGPGADERLIREARRLAEERRKAARQTREADALARSVVEAAAGKPVIEYLRELADTADLRTPVDGTLLWSYLHQVRDGAPVSNQDLAAAYARDPRRSPNLPRPLPIHLTPGGEWFAKILDNPNVRRKLVSPRERAELWERLSQRFAGQARGFVLVFAATAHPKSYLYRHELPILRRNPAVGSRRIIFVHAVDNRAGEAGQRVFRSSDRQDRVRPGRRSRSAYPAPERPDRIGSASNSRAPAKSHTISTLMFCCGLLFIAYNPQRSAELLNTFGVGELLKTLAKCINAFLEGLTAG